MRKYEIYLALKYNDGKVIESEKIVAVWAELAEAFAGITVSSLSAPYQGRWKYGGVEYIDDIIKIDTSPLTTGRRRNFSKISKNISKSLSSRLIF